MTTIIDWDNYEVIEKEDYTTEELSDTIEEIREAMDDFVREMKPIPQMLEDLMEVIVEIEEE